MNTHLLVSLFASVAVVTCAVGCSAGDDSGIESAESAQTAGSKVFLKNAGPRPIVLFNAKGEKISGGTGPGETSTFDRLGIGTYTVQNDQTAKIGEISVAVGSGPEITWSCGPTSCKEEKGTAAPPAVGPAPTKLEVQLVFGQSGHKLFAYPNLDNLDQKIFAVAGDRAKHVLPAGKTIGIDVWSIDRPGEKSGDWRTFDVPADSRFEGGVLSCAVAVPKVVHCTLKSADGNLVSTGDGKIALAQRP